MSLSWSSPAFSARVCPRQSSDGLQLSEAGECCPGIRPEMAAIHDENRSW